MPACTATVSLPLYTVHSALMYSAQCTNVQCTVTQCTLHSALMYSAHCTKVQCTVNSECCSIQYNIQLISQSTVYSLQSTDLSLCVVRHVCVLCGHGHARSTLSPHHCTSHCTHTMYTVNSSLYTVYFTLYTLHFILYTVNCICTVYILKCTLCTRSVTHTTLLH